MRVLAAVLLGCAALAPIDPARLGGAPVAEAETSAPVDGRALTVATGMDAVVEDLAPSLIAGFEQTGLPDAYAAAAATAAEGAFAAEPMLAAIGAALDRTLDASERGAVAGFYESALGARILAFEKAAVGADRRPGYDAALADAAVALEADPARAEIIDAINEAIYAAEFGEYFARTILRAMLTGLLSSRSDSPTVDSETLEALVDEQMAAVSSATEGLVRLSTAYAYREASDEDLELYRDFLRSAPTQRFYAASYAALARALDAASFDFGRRMTAALEAKGI